jgi:hypothetical protein
MSQREDDFHARKLEHIKKDYDRVFSAMLKLGDYGNSIRYWSIVVIVAYLGFAKAYVDKGTDIPVLPLLGAIYGFWVMEALVKAQMYLYRDYTLEKADELFSTSNDATFKRLVKDYQFFSKQGDSPGKKWWTEGGKLHRLSRELVNCQTVVFYVLPLILITWYSASWNRPTLTLTVALPLWIILLLPAVLFLLIWFIYWWKYPRQRRIQLAR